jgi:hypothetical protein
MSEMFYATPNQLWKINQLTHLLSGVDGVPSASMPLSKSKAHALLKDMVKVEKLMNEPEVLKPEKAKSAKKASPARDGEIKVIKISI